MHAKLAPGRPAGRLRADNNLYVEDLRDGRITPLTHSNSADEINGTFDWVYEEEFGLRDGFRWSPDGKSIAYWQLNTAGHARVPAGQHDRCALSADHTGQISQGRRTECRVPDRRRAGRRRETTFWLPCRRPARELRRLPGVVRLPKGSSCSNSTGCRTRSGSSALVISRRTASIETILEEHDDAWIDLQDELPLDRQGRLKDFLWLSERDGWRHIYRVGSHKAERRSLITPATST